MLIAIAIAEEILGFQRIALKFSASEFSLTFAKSLSCTGLGWDESRWYSRSGLRFCYFGHGGHDGAWGEYGFLWGTKPKELQLKPVQLNESNFLPKSKKTLKLKTSMQSFVILGSLLQWRWQWASIGHFVFLFSKCLFWNTLMLIVKSNEHL